MASAMEKYLLKTPGNRVSETLNSKMSLDASVLKNLCLWCEFQSRLLFVIRLPLKNFLTALIDLGGVVQPFMDWVGTEGVDLFGTLVLFHSLSPS